MLSVGFVCLNGELISVVGRQAPSDRLVNDTLSVFCLKAQFQIHPFIYRLSVSFIVLVEHCDTGHNDLFYSKAVRFILFPSKHRRRSAP